jgi:hypothetical protein
MGGAVRVIAGARAPVAGMHSVGIQWLDFEGVGGVTENLDAARLVGLQPDGRVGLADMAQQRSDTHLGHTAIMPEMR